MADVEEVKIESDERGFELHIVVGDDIEVDEQGRAILNIQGVAEELYNAVKGSIGPWLAERDEAMSSSYLAERLAWARDDEDAGYDPLDPKHPTYHERMAGAADHARKVAKGE